MKNKMVYLVAAGLAFTLSIPVAMAKKRCNYYKVMSGQMTMQQKEDSVRVEKALTFPVVVEHTCLTSTTIDGQKTPVYIEEMTSLPVMLERSSTVKPHHWPISFGVWP